MGWGEAVKVKRRVVNKVAPPPPGGNEMIPSEPCGCDVFRGSYGEIIWEKCPMHEAAPQLLEACEQAERILCIATTELEVNAAIVLQDAIRAAKEK